MRSALPLPPFGFDELPVEERIDYVQSLWDRIAAEAGQVPLQEWQERLLAERSEAHRAAPDQAAPWREALDRVRGQLRNRK